jgi:hypothetical protein
MKMWFEPLIISLQLISFLFFIYDLCENYL